MSDPASASDDVSLVDILIFLKRQRRALGFVFTLCFGLTIGFIFSRPMLYQAKTDVLIGSAAAFANAPVEPFDQLKYLIESRYNDDLPVLKQKPVLINIIRNTNILNVTAIHEQREGAVKLLEDIAQTLIDDHAAKLEQKKADARKLLAGSVNLSERDITNYIDILSSANRTRLVSEVKVKELAYSGLLTKGLALGFFGSVLISVLSVFAWKLYKDLAEEMRKKS